MRTILLIPVAILFVAGAGIGVSAALGHIDLRSMMLAAGACLIAGLLSQVPMMLARGTDQLATSQAGLVSTMLHVFVAAACAAVVIFNHSVTGISFIAWLMAFYLATLTIIAIGIVQSIRKAAPVKPA